MINGKIRLVAFLLAVCTLFSFVLTSCKNDPDDDDDGKKEENSEYMNAHDEYLDYFGEFDMDYAYYLMESGSVSDYEAANLYINNDIAAEGSACSGWWKNQASNSTLTFPLWGLDEIKSFDVLVLNVYSGKANGAGFVINIYCQYSESDGKDSYFKYTGSVDWTGWKQIVVNIDDMTKAYSPNKNQISSVRMATNGWGNTPQSDTQLYFDSVFFATMGGEYSFDVSTIGDYNYDHIKDTLVELMTGGVTYKNADTNAQQKLDSYVSAAQNAADSMKTGELPWSYDMNTTAGITSCYTKIYNMALGYALEGTETYHDKALFSKIKTAMEYMHENYYKSQSLHSYPSRNNWWDWEIGSAQKIVKILLLCEDAFTQEEIDKYLKPVNEYVPFPSMTMANLVDLAYVCVGAGALQKDYYRLVMSRNKLDECTGYVLRGDGFYEDGSFVQHDVIAYTGSYGPIMLEALSLIILALDDTCFHVNDKLLDAQYGWAVDSFVPLMYHGAFFGLVRGRSICRSSTDVSLGGTAVSGMLRMTRYLDSTRAKVIKEILLEYANYSDSYYMSSLSPYDIVIYKEIKNDTSVTARVDYSITKMFAMMDRAISVNENYGVGISLSSSRIAKYEAINEENGKGWYTGDGMLYIYTSVNDYDANYWKNINYYRIPGTTVTTVARTDENITASKTLSQYNFVGGSYLNNTMTVAMQFESATSGMASSGMLSSTLNGKKAWFIFDDEVVCLGTGISCSDNYSTETIIENRRLNSSENLYIDGSAVAKTAGVAEDCTSLWFSTLGGIYLPEETDVYYVRTSASFLELYINHGKNFKNESYAYVLLPTMTQEETNAYCASPDIEILSNTSEVQAVKDGSTNTTGYVFWKATAFDGITVSAPCTVTVCGNTIAISDPTMKLDTLTVTVNGQSFKIEPQYGQTYTFTF